jgi:signal transduction histidine kinase
VIVCISDQGPGIDARDLPHIFDRFYRSTNAVKQTKGAGLGLYLARAIVEAHGGRIWADASTGSPVTASSRTGPDGPLNAKQASRAKPASGARICFSLPR